MKNFIREVVYGGVATVFMLTWAFGFLPFRQACAAVLSYFVILYIGIDIYKNEMERKAGTLPEPVAQSHCGCGHSHPHTHGRQIKDVTPTIKTDYIRLGRGK